MSQPFNYTYPYNFPPYNPGKSLNHKFFVSAHAREGLASIPRDDAVMLVQALLSRDGNPGFNSLDACRFPGRDGLHRLRVGHYRLLYWVDYDEDEDVVVLATVFDDKDRKRLAAR